MKISYLNKAGKWLMEKSGFRITIVDDEAAYFNDNMLNAAKSIGYYGIERLFRVDEKTLQRLLRNPPHIIIFDVRGVTEKEVAKDGLALVSLFRKNTKSYVAVTSAHRFHLSNHTAQADYVIEDRTLTTADFIEELEKITSDYLTRRSKFYKLVLLRLGLLLSKAALSRA
ncbi:MAG: hypothetical protein KF771_12050 [Burkholderiales bacterium]|nr:hypothetical protein [Burkholderiales bacterium]